MERLLDGAGAGRLEGVWPIRALARAFPLLPYPKGIDRTPSIAPLRGAHCTAQAPGTSSGGQAARHWRVNPLPSG